MATLGVKGVELWSTGPHIDGRIVKGREKASQSFKKGDFLSTDTNGVVRIAVDTESGIYALALEDASGTTNNEVDILLLDGTMLFSASVSAAGAAAATAITNVGLRCSWIRSTVTGETNKNVIDTSDTTTPDLEIMMYDRRDPLGDTNGRLIFRVIESRILARGV
jgi:hypothetical protein